MTIDGVALKNTYVLDTGSESAAARLRMLDEVYGASTRQMLLEAGLKPGMRALDMACGVGTLSCWMAGRVGPTGQVVAADISAAQLDVAREEWKGCADLPEIDFIEASAYDTGLPSESFDIVHTRFLLCHLDEPGKALREFYRLLKPGGVVVCHDIYLTGITASPACRHYERSVEIGLALGEAIGVNYDFGLLLPLALLEAGFHSPVVRMETPMYFDGPKKRLWEWTFIEASPRMLSTGVASAEEIDSVVAGMVATRENERALAAQWPMVGARARK